MKKGYLLINLGTPDSPRVADVCRYLKVFLSDPRVITLPTAVRTLLLYGIILPFRSFQSAHAYQSIWTDKGSPLLVNSLACLNALQAKHPTAHFALAMRYGNPGIKAGLEALKGCEEITILPLYPQYASASTGSSIEAVLEAIKSTEVFPSIRIIRDFYNHPSFIDASASLLAPYLSPDAHVLFSYHGLPKHQLESIGCKPVCLSPCQKPTGQNAACYRAQCFDTTRRIAKTMGLKEDRYTTAFQSRLGRTPWIEPYTDEILPALLLRGVKKLVVSCPSFVADCLETLEEIGMRLKEDWVKLGGEELILVPCLNSHPEWINALGHILGLDENPTSHSF